MLIFTVPSFYFYCHTVCTVDIFENFLRHSVMHWCIAHGMDKQLMDGSLAGMLTV